MRVIATATATVASAVCFVLLQAITSHAEPINTGAYKGQWTKGTQVAPVDFTRQDLFAAFTFPEGSGNLTVDKGPFLVENSTNGDVYSFSSAKDEKLNTNSCFISRINTKTGKSETKIVDSSNKHNISRNCSAYDAAFSPDGLAYYAVGFSGVKGPFLMKVTTLGAKIDWTKTLGSTGDISSLLPADGEIVSATVTIHPGTLNVYMVWNMKSGSSYLVEYAVDLDLYKFLGVLEGHIAASPRGVAAHSSKSELIIGGLTTQDSDNSTFRNAQPFILHFDISNFNVSKHRTWSPQTNMKHANVTNLAYDSKDGSAYLGVNSYNRKNKSVSAMFKLETVTPFSVITHLKKRLVPDVLLSIDAIPGSFCYAICEDDNGKRNVITFDYLLRKKTVTTVRLIEGTSSPSTGDEGTVPSQIHISYKKGLILLGSVTSTGTPQAYRLGASSYRALIIHQVTRQALTITSDHTLHLFPIETLPGTVEDPPTLNQQWDIIPGTKSIRNAATGEALTIKGHPAKIPGYDQENGHNIVGQDYRMAETQRWVFNSDGTIANMLDTRCLGLDRDYLRGSRFPGKAGLHQVPNTNQTVKWRHSTGLPVITVYCLYDRLILWEVVPVV